MLRKQEIENSRRKRVLKLPKDSRDVHVQYYFYNTESYVLLSKKTHENLNTL